MAKRRIKDDFPQVMYLKCVMSAANILTFAQLSIGTALFEYAGLILHRIEYQPDLDALDEMTTAKDAIQMAVTGSSSISNLGSDQPEVYDRVIIGRWDAGAAADNTVFIENTIQIHDFTSFPGGGILAPLQDLYLAMYSVGLASAATGYARVWFSVRELKAEDYIELAQRLRVLST